MNNECVCDGSNNCEACIQLEPIQNYYGISKNEALFSLILVIGIFVTLFFILRWISKLKITPKNNQWNKLSILSFVLFIVGCWISGNESLNYPKFTFTIPLAFSGAIISYDITKRSGEHGKILSFITIILSGFVTTLLLMYLFILSFLGPLPTF